LNKGAYAALVLFLDKDKKVWQSELRDSRNDARTHNLPLKLTPAAKSTGGRLSLIGGNRFRTERSKAWNLARFERRLFRK
jgi:hypothetical protein